MEDVIVKVRESRIGQKVVTIPKESDIESGEYVRVIRISDTKSKKR